MGKVLIVEGYVDVVAAHQAGIEFVVATLGTSLTEEHVRLIRRYLREDNKNVILSFDADDAGVKAALRAAELIQASGDDLTLKVLSLPQGEDPDSLIRKGQVALFHKAIDSAVTVPEFRLKSIEKKHDTSTDGRKTGASARGRRRDRGRSVDPRSRHADPEYRRVSSQFCE